MKKIVLSLAALFFAAAGFAQAGFGEARSIDKGWRFKLDSEADYSAADYDASSWRWLDLPHDWSIEGPASPSLASCTGYLSGGIGWYRKSFSVDESKSTGKVFLYFEGVYCRSTVWVNGHEIGYRPNGYVSFMYDITSYVNYHLPNTVAVKVDHSRYADSRWYTGSGIYRDVYVVTSDKLHIDRWGVSVRTVQATPRKAVLEVTTELKNERGESATVAVRQKLLFAGKPVAEGVRKLTLAAGETASVAQTLTVGAPRLWDIDDPNLYELHTSVTENGMPVDEAVNTTGIREIRFDPDEGFFLNGRNRKMKGVCIHHDAGSLGAVAYRDVWERRLRSLKQLGCNAIRMSHNPQDALIYDLCDELGLLVMDEFFDEWELPKKKWIEGWNVGEHPNFDGSSSFFEQWWEQDVTDIVRHNRNHPSIVLWSVGNEVDYPNDPYSHPVLDREGISQKTVPGYKPELPHADRIGIIGGRLAAKVRSIDTSRPVTGALAGVVMSNETTYPAALDVVGYNYTENRYRKDHELYPDRIIYGSETRHEPQNWYAVRDNDFIFGQFLWTGIDYLGESMRWPSRGFGSGLLDLAGFKKPRGYFRESLWSDTPMVYLGSMRDENVRKNTLTYDLNPVWQYADGQLIRVVCYTNCDSVRLTLNGKPVAERPVRDRFDIPGWKLRYEPGTLKAEGYRDGKVVAETSLKSFTCPMKLRISADMERLAGKGRIAHVVAEVVDKNGNPVFYADNMITCKVRGGGALLGMENADNGYTGSFAGNSLRAHHGKVMAYVVAAEEEGEMNVEFSAPWLKGGSVTIKIGK